MVVCTSQRRDNGSEAERPLGTLSLSRPIYIKRWTKRKSEGFTLRPCRRCRRALKCSAGSSTTTVPFHRVFPAIVFGTLGRIEFGRDATTRRRPWQRERLLCEFGIT